MKRNAISVCFSLLTFLLCHADDVPAANRPGVSNSVNPNSVVAATNWSGARFELLPMASPAGVNPESTSGVAVSRLAEHQSDEVPASSESSVQTDTQDTNSLYSLGRTSFANKDYQKAAEIFQELVTLQTNSASGFLWLSRSLYRLQHFSEAESACRQALTLDSTNAYAYYLLGLSLEKLGKPDEAVSMLEKSCLLDTKRVAPYLRLGQLQFDRENYSAALALLQKSVALNPTNQDTQLWLGRDLYQLADYAAAVAPLQKAVDLGSDPADAGYWLMRTLVELTRYDDAITLLNKRLSSPGEEADNRLWLGICHCYKKSYEEAIPILKKYISLEPTNYYGHYWLGYALFQLGRNEQAADAFAGALLSQPDDYEANFQRALNLMAIQRFQEAMPNLEKALAIEPQNQFARWLLLAAYLTTGQTGKIARLHLGILAVIPIFFALAYAVGLFFLMRISLRVGFKPAPGIGFTLAWFGVMFDGQLVVFLSAALIFSLEFSQVLGAGMILWVLPLVAAAFLGFARQPWGNPFAWPLRWSSPRVFWLSLAGLSAVVVFESLYGHLIEHLTRKPIPDQEIVAWMKAGLRNSPCLTVIGISIAAPVGEEILFRGLLFGCLKRWLRPGWVIVLTAVVFALAHFQLIFMLPLLGVGLVLGYARQKSGGLALPMFIHSLNNSLALLVLVTNSSGVP